MSSTGFGFFGKLPSRGDFVRDGLPRPFVTCWDNWLKCVLPATLAAVGARWPQAPVWHFHLAAGLCHAEAISGVVLPSRDTVARCFPLTLAAVRRDGCAGSLASAEAVGRLAIADTWAPDALRVGLARLAVCGGLVMPPDTSCWHRTDGTGQELLLRGLPDAETFATMLAEDGNAG